MTERRAADAVEHGVLALYWPARKEELDACAEKATLTLGELPLIGFTQSRRLGRSRRQAEKRVFEPTRVTVLPVRREPFSR
jgi:hypothetical protein